MKGLGASKRVFELLDKVPMIPNIGGLKPAMLIGNLGNYPTRPDHPVLKAMNLKVEAGTSVAIVGSSGSGKSTIAYLIERFYDPNSGQVLIDNNLVSDVDPTWLRQQIGIVGQEPILFAVSIEENILYGRPNATKEQIIEAANLANAHSFITSFPEGYNTVVGKGGGLLSGGQKQRIAIARAIVRDPKILILDEATSALDAESEMLVQEAVQRLMKQRTTIVIAHRLSTIKSADKIAVLEKGEIVEFGTYEELLSKKGSFVRLFEKQIYKGERDDVESV